MPIDLAKITAIDVHVHAEVSCHDPEDPVMGKFFDAASAYFKAPRERPKMPEIVEIYRLSGDADYLLKIVVPDIDRYDSVYKRLIRSVDLLDVSSAFAMETIKCTTVLVSSHTHAGSMGQHQVVSATHA